MKQQSQIANCDANMSIEQLGGAILNPNGAIARIGMQDSNGDSRGQEDARGGT